MCEHVSMSMAGDAPWFHSRAARRETRHTVRLVEQHLRPSDTILDIGCGAGYVARELARCGRAVIAVDIVDARRVPAGRFLLWDGVTLPLATGAVDVALFSYVLHHVPDPLKPRLLHEALRVARRAVMVFEDTPQSALDRVMSHVHGEKFRRSIRSDADFGFFSREQWIARFAGWGLALRESSPIGRLERAWWQPFARSVFILEGTSAAS